jgi:hypothetical protein
MNVSNNGEKEKLAVAAAWMKDSQGTTTTSVDSGNLKFTNDGTRTYLMKENVSQDCLNVAGYCNNPYANKRKIYTKGVSEAAHQTYETCGNDFQTFNLSKDFDMSFNADVSETGAGCDLALYFVDMKKAVNNTTVSSTGDFYCDANAGKSQCGAGSAYGEKFTFPSHKKYSYCTEIDIFEANKYGIHVTPHSCQKPINTMTEKTQGDCKQTNGTYGSGCDGDGAAMGIGGTGIISALKNGTLEQIAGTKIDMNNYTASNGKWKSTHDTKEDAKWELYGPGASVIDTEQPFDVLVRGKWLKEDGTTKCDSTAADCYMSLEMQLTQHGRNASAKMHGYKNEQKLDEMVLSMSRWKDTACGTGSTFWLDGCQDSDDNWTKCWKREDLDTFGDHVKNPACMNKPNEMCKRDATISNLSFNNI